MEAGESGVAVRRRIGIHRGKEGLIKGGRRKERKDKEAESKGTRRVPINNQS